MRKYAEELNVSRDQIPYFYYENDDKRMKKWKQQQEVYGFDERETWALDYMFYIWLYERLRMYEDVTIVDTSRMIKINDEEKSFGNWIQQLKSDCKFIIECDYLEYQKDKADKIFDLLKELIWFLWW